MNFWFELKKNEDTSNMIHNHLGELTIPFTPSMIYLYLLNLNCKTFKELDDSIEDFKLLNY